MELDLLEEDIRERWTPQSYKNRSQILLDGLTDISTVSPSDKPLVFEFARDVCVDLAQHRETDWIAELSEIRQEEPEIEFFYQEPADIEVGEIRCPLARPLYCVFLPSVETLNAFVDSRQYIFASGKGAGFASAWEDFWQHLDEQVRQILSILPSERNENEAMFYDKVRQVINLAMLRRQRPMQVFKVGRVVSLEPLVLRWRDSEEEFTVDFGSVHCSTPNLFVNALIEVVVDFDRQQRAITNVLAMRLLDEIDGENDGLSSLTFSDLPSSSWSEL